MVKSWQKIASNSNRLQIENEREQGVFRSDGDAVHHLCLPGGVIDLVSLWQICHEGMLQRMA